MINAMAVAVLAAGLSVGPVAWAGIAHADDPCSLEAPTKFAQVCVDAFLQTVHKWGITSGGGDTQLLSDGKLACYYIDHYQTITGAELDTILNPKLKEKDPSLSDPTSLSNAAAWALCTA
jgi:hypothetical protein